MRKFKFILPLSATLVAVSPIITLTNCNVSNSNQDTQLAKEVAEKGVSIESTDIKLFEESTIVLNLPKGKTIVAIKIKIGNLIVTEDDVTISGNKITIPAMKMVSTDITILSITFSDEINIQLSQEVKNLGVSIKSIDIALKKNSTIALNLPKGKVITAIKIKIGKATYSEKYVNINNNVITIPASKMTCCSVIISSVTLEAETPIIIPFDFLTCSWSEIDNLCRKLEKDEIDEKTFCANISIGNQPISSLDELIGIERTIRINNVDHVIRVIDTLHDTIVDEDLKGKKAVLTFELVTLLSGSDGIAITSQSNFVPLNNDYPNSILRAHLTGNGTSRKVWDRTALGMLSNENTGCPELVNAIKTTSHLIATTIREWATDPITQTEYSDKLFVPTYYNMTTNQTEYCQETQQYIFKYYRNKQSQSEEAINAARIKTDAAGGEDRYWLASAGTEHINDAWLINADGTVEQNANQICVGVSFAFCI